MTDQYENPEEQIPLLVQGLLYVLQDRQGIVVRDKMGELWIVYREDVSQDSADTYLKITPIANAGGLEDAQVEEGMIIWMHDTEEDMIAAREQSKRHLH